MQSIDTLTSGFGLCLTNAHSNCVKCFCIRPGAKRAFTNLVELLKRFRAILLGLSTLQEVWTKTRRGPKTYPYLHETVLHRRNYRQPMLYAAPQS